MTTRDCDCPHQFPACCCALGYTDESLAYHSRVASAVIGWPALDFDLDALAEHNERMRAAREEREAIEALNAQSPAPLAMARADKPRIPLGTKLGDPGCIPCQEAKA